MNLEKLKEIAEHLKEWIDCEIGYGCGKCDEMRNIIKELTDIAEAMQPETTDSVEIAKDIIANIYSLMGKHKNGADMDLSSATDAMYRFIKTIE